MIGSISSFCGLESIAEIKIKKDHFSLHLSFLCFSLIDYFRDSVSNDSSCPFCFFLRKTRRNANFERGLQLPPYIFWCRVDCAWHAVKSSDKNSVRQRLLE